MNAIKEKERLFTLLTEFRIPAHPVRALKKIDIETVYVLYKLTLDTLKVSQEHDDIEVLREFYDDITEVLKVRMSQDAVDRMMKQGKYSV